MEDTKKESNRKYFSICINAKKEPKLVEFLNSIDNRNEFLTGLVKDYMNKLEEGSDLEPSSNDKIVDKLTENLVSNTEIMKQMQGVMSKMVEVMSKGVVLATNQVTCETSVTAELDEEKVLANEVLEVSDEVAFNVLDGFGMD